MGLLDKITELFGGAKGKLPANMDSVDELKAKAADMLDQHADTINQLTDKIPGEMDDQLVEKAKDALK
jgi:hypothetical protein